MSDEHTRKFQCEYYTVYARPNSCFFCDNCHDIFYDYINGYAYPYMWLCDKGNDTEVGMMGKCQDFYEVAEQTEPSTERHLPDYSYESEMAQRLKDSTDCAWGRDDD